MDIRALTIDEISQCVDHGQAFYDSREKQLGGIFDATKFVEYWTQQYLFGSGLIIGAWNEGRLAGGFGGVLVEGIYDGVLHAHEHFWWFPNGGRDAVKLIHQFEAWAKLQGARSLDLAHFADTPRVGELYTVLGYTALESHYRKVL